MTTTRALSMLLSATVGAAIALTGSAALRGEFSGYDGYANGVIPVCATEDCSDQPNQVGVWTSPNDGRMWLSVGESSVLVAR